MEYANPARFSSFLIAPPSPNQSSYTVNFIRKTEEETSLSWSAARLN
jgi:hypothetical protein